MSRMRWLAIVAAVVLGASTLAGLLPGTALAAPPEVERRARVKPSPVFPELARKLKLSGTVRIEVTVAPNGTVVSAKAVGGHPVFIESALEAVKKWRFEPASETTTDVLTFEFKAEVNN